MTFIIYNPVTNLFDFFINSLILELKNRNINSIFMNETYIPNKTDIILIIINPHFIYDDKEIEKSIINISKKFTFKILYLTEPINFLIEKKVYMDLIKMIKPFALWTYTLENFNKLNSILNIFKIFPNNIEYHFTDINIENLKNRSKDKIVFFGNINQNRVNICDTFGNILINKTDCWTKDDWTNVLNDNLFYLNIHRRLNCKSFESFRIVPILANGGIIFSERCNEKEEHMYKEYNIIFVERDDLYDTFIKYCKNINYHSIFEKANLFRNNVIKDDLDKFLEKI